MPDSPTPPTAAAPLLPGLDLDAFHETLRNARQKLLDERNEHGWWTGELSSSALSTATAIVAMELARRNGCQAARDVEPLIERGVRWLIDKQNTDGGWGDTDKSKSNISTTMLVWAAMGVGKSRKAEKQESRKAEKQNGSENGSFDHPQSAIRDPQSISLSRCEAWLKQYAGSLEIPALVEAVMKRYGKDRTFSVPILTMCALCGRLGDPETQATWKWVKQLPFEFAAFPRSWFKVLNLQVVSYALPALIAIGMVRHHHRASWNPVARFARWITKSRVLKLLEKIQPPNGGFLEATPLTSFVSMSLAACGFATHPVVTRGITFIKSSARPDGSWAIDTNLATWVTTLSVNALAAGGKLHEYLNDQERTVIRDWLLKQQYKEVHPYTGAAPGGWAWTDLPGGVPDADDTSGAVIALSHLGRIPGTLGFVNSPAWRDAIYDGCDWLYGLKNRDKGMPTFCRGWGKLPFDQSCADITAHAHRAFQWRMSVREQHSREAGAVLDEMPVHETIALQDGMTDYLRKSQAPDGSWSPLWFGDQHSLTETNPVYGTSRVVVAMERTDGRGGFGYLMRAQNEDGGWGGTTGSPSSIEETSLALEACAAVIHKSVVMLPAVAALQGRIDRLMLQKEKAVSKADYARAAELRDEFEAVNRTMEWRTFLLTAKPQAAITRGVHWLIEHTARGTSFPPSPIGFYFAKLWYYEKLYPIIFTVAALERVAAMLESTPGK